MGKYASRETTPAGPVSWVDIANKPNTISGFGIIDAINSSGVPVAEQVAVWIDGDTVKGSNKLLFDDSEESLKTVNINASGNIIAYSAGGVVANIWDGLPTASASVKGGIKVGSGLAINNQVLSVSGNFASTWGTITGTLTNQTDLNSALGAKADLVDGKIPAAQLPAYVDDVLEYANSGAFPGTGETGKIYVALNTNLAYRWSGSAYVEISPSLALGETSSTAGRGDRAKTAYDHSQVTHNATLVGLGNVTNESKATMFTNPAFTGTPTGITKAHVGLGNVDNESKATMFANPVLTGTAKVIKPGTTGNALTLEGGLIDAGASAWGCEIDLDFMHDTTYNAGKIKLQGNLYSQYATRFVLSPRIGDNTFIDMLFVNPTGIAAAGSVQGTSLKTTNWTFEESGNDLLDKRGSTSLFKRSSTGTLSAVGDIIAYATL